MKENLKNHVFAVLSKPVLGVSCSTWLGLLILVSVILHGILSKDSQEKAEPLTPAQEGWYFASPHEFVPAKVFQAVGSQSSTPEPFSPRASQNPPSVSPETSSNSDANSAPDVQADLTSEVPQGTAE